MVCAHVLALWPLLLLLWVIFVNVIITLSCWFLIVVYNMPSVRKSNKSILLAFFYTSLKLSACFTYSRFLVCLLRISSGMITAKRSTGFIDFVHIDVVIVYDLFATVFSLSLPLSHSLSLIVVWEKRKNFKKYTKKEEQASKWHYIINEW